MNYRTLGKTGLQISEISLGTWQVGGRWGEKFDHNNASRTLNMAIDKGVNFIDTADVYNNGLSEKVLGEVVRQRKEEVIVATKCGRKIRPHVAEKYTPEKLRGFVEASLKNMGLDTIDLMQLHCPPTEVYDRPEIFELFETLKNEGKIRHFGVSVEKIEEARKAMSYSNVATIQIIFNMFRHKPAEVFFTEAYEKKLGIIARVPLASGLLSGKMSLDTKFSEDDHRYFNINGEFFDAGETFSGVNFEFGLEAVDELKALFPEQPGLAAWAIRWVLMFPEVSTVIPGASHPEQAKSNIEAGKLPKLSDAQMEGIKDIYNRYFRSEIHGLW